MPTLLTRFTDLLFPRNCAICEQRLQTNEELFCSNCKLHLPRTGFELSPLDNPMARDFWGRIPVEKVAALFYYNSHIPVSKAIYNMKYHGQSDLGVEMGVFAAHEFLRTDFFDGIDIIVPVPLARSRERERGYNQSERIAFGVSHATRIPMSSYSVCRLKYLGSQTTKSRDERIENVKDMFELRKPEKLHGKHVLIIDDIVTTGATCCSLANEILKAGDVKLSIMSLGFTKE